MCANDLLRCSNMLTKKRVIALNVRANTLYNLGDWANDSEHRPEQTAFDTLSVGGPSTSLRVGGPTPSLCVGDLTTTLYVGGPHSDVDPQRTVMR